MFLVKAFPIELIQNFVANEGKGNICKCLIAHQW